MKHSRIDWRCAAVWFLVPLAFWGFIGVMAISIIGTPLRTLVIGGIALTLVVSIAAAIWRGVE